jgi:hypothetical protein
LDRFNLFTLTDKAEQDDNCAHIYNKSLLYLVSNAFEKIQRIPGIKPDGEPILGMQTFAARSADLSKMLKDPRARWLLTPGLESSARHHGDFDNDDNTLHTTLDSILSKAAQPSQLRFSPMARQICPSPQMMELLAE